MQAIFIACVAVLKGFPEAIEAVFPKAVVQLRIVQMVRHSLNYVSWKRREEVAADLRHVYQAATAQEAELRLGEFEARRDADYLRIGQSWRRNWSRLSQKWTLHIRDWKGAPTRFTIELGDHLCVN